ncbi:hypothetical protein DRQ53_12055 [bacterium]|nr:MAG: hypothetical protein DRQ53_12055 [bacterium]
MSFSRVLFVVLISLIALPLVPSVQAQLSWAVADRPDEKIESLVTRLEPYLEPLPGREDAAGAILYHQIVVAPKEGESSRCENMILTIQDPAGMPEELLQPWQSGSAELVSMTAFVRRDSEYRRLLETEVIHVPGRADIGRGHFEITWGDLREGDVIGWSMVTQQEEPYRFVPIRLGQRVPIVIAALHVQSGGKFAYELRNNAVSLKDISQKKKDVQDGRAMDVKASTNQRPAVDTLPDTTPWPNDYPYMALYLKEVRIDSESQFLLPGWAKTGGWNQGVMNIGGLVERSAEDLGGLDITLSAITTGKTTSVAKAEAVCGWVRDKFELLEGPDVLSRGLREFEEVVKSKQATALEKALLMAVLLDKLDVPATIAGIRSPDLGQLDRDWPETRQFSALAVRTVEAGVIRYWVPQCTECVAGETPASWQGADVVTYDYETIAVAEKYQEALRQKAMVEGQFDLARIQADVESQPWVIFEKVGE